VRTEDDEAQWLDVALHELREHDGGVDVGRRQQEGEGSEEPLN
jgi:hypothetical protein